MKKTTTMIAIILVLSLFLPVTAYAQQNVKTTEYKIEISTNGEMDIKETITVIANNNQTVEKLEFSIMDMDNVDDLKISINGTNSNYDIEDNIVTCNISNMSFNNQSNPLNVIISYVMPAQTEKFEKKILSSETEDVSVVLNEKEIFQSNSMSYGDHFRVTLYEPSETPLSWYMIGFIILLMVLLGVVSFYSFKKQKSQKTNDIYGGSEEVYNTQKKLLTQLLKELEKQHRDNKISDDTYHKIKGKYKQEAVNTMKKLDDFKASEVK